MENASVSTAEDQHRFIRVILVSNAAQCLSVYQITFAQHYNKFTASTTFYYSL